MLRRRVTSLIDPVVVGLGLVLFGLDQLAKYLIVQGIGPSATQHSIEVLGTYVRLVYSTNTGAVFGTFTGRVGILAVVSLVAVPLILFSRALFPSDSAFVRVSLGLLFGGNLGNLADRWLRGFVVDFVDMGVGSLRWFTYNIADACFVIGVIALTFAMLFLVDEHPTEDHPTENRAEEAAGESGGSGEAARPS